jgi:hypothetical protein
LTTEPSSLAAKRAKICAKGVSGASAALARIGSAAKSASANVAARLTLRRLEPHTETFLPPVRPWANPALVFVRRSI